MSYLDSLASGLRGVGMALSPQAFGAGVDQDKQQSLIDEQRRNTVIAQVVKAVESGAMPQSAAAPILTRMGIPLNSIGPTPETLARIENAKRDTEFRNEFGKLNSQDPAYYDNIIGIAGKYGKQDLAMNALKAKEDRSVRAQTAYDALQERIRANDLRHDEAMTRFGDTAENNAQRMAMTERYNADRIELMRQRNDLLAYMKSQSPNGTLAQQQKASDRKVRLTTALTQIEDLQKMLEDNPRSTVGLVSPLIRGVEAVKDVVAPGSAKAPAIEAEQAKQTLIKNMTDITGSLARESNKDTARLERALGFANVGTQDSMKKALAIWGDEIRSLMDKDAGGAQRPQSKPSRVLQPNEVFSNGRILRKNDNGTIEVVK